MKSVSPPAIEAIINQLTDPYMYKKWWNAAF